jgi:hypothetical protein
MKAPLDPKLGVDVLNQYHDFPPGLVSPRETTHSYLMYTPGQWLTVDHELKKLYKKLNFLVLEPRFCL